MPPRPVCPYSPVPVLEPRAAAVEVAEEELVAASDLASTDPSAAPASDPPLEEARPAEAPLEGRVVQGCMQWHPSHHLVEIKALTPGAVTTPSVAAWSSLLRRGLTVEWLLLASQRPCTGVFQSDLRTGDLMVFMSRAGSLVQLVEQLQAVDLGSVMVPEVIRQQLPPPLHQCVSSTVNAWAYVSTRVSFRGIAPVSSEPALEPREGALVVAVPMVLEIPDEVAAEIVQAQAEAVQDAKWRKVVGSQVAVEDGHVSPDSLALLIHRQHAASRLHRFQRHPLLRSELRLRLTTAGGLEAGPLSWAPGVGALMDVAALAGAEGPGRIGLLDRLPMPMELCGSADPSQPEDPRKRRGVGTFQQPMYTMASRLEWMQETREALVALSRPPPGPSRHRCLRGGGGRRHRHRRDMGIPR